MQENVRNEINADPRLRDKGVRGRIDHFGVMVAALHHILSVRGPRHDGINPFGDTRFHPSPVYILPFGPDNVGKQSSGLIEQIDADVPYPRGQLILPHVVISVAEI